MILWARKNMSLIYFDHEGTHCVVIRSMLMATESGGMVVVLWFYHYAPLTHPVPFEMKPSGVCPE